MKILYFTKGGRNVPSSNERVWIISDLLKAHYDWASDILSARDASFWDALKKLYASKYDILIVHKSLFSVWVFALIVLARFIFQKPMVFDLDDAQWVHSPFKSKVFAFTARMVFAGSHEIKSWVERYNKNIVLIPTLVDHEHFARSPVVHGEKPIYTLGWVGAGPGHFQDGNFHLVKPALEELGRRGKKIRFRVVGTRGYEPLETYLKSDLYEFEAVPFVPYSEVPKQIQQFDIGIMPLVDTPFNRAKCGAKAIQYMACCVPPVVSPVGENAIIVDDGVNGFCARTTEEWVSAIEKLLADAKLRSEFGVRGQEKVAREYSHMAVLKKYAHTVETL